MWIPYTCFTEAAQSSTDSFSAVFIIAKLYIIGKVALSYSFTQFSTTRKQLLTLVVNIHSYKMLYFTEQGNIFVLID